MTTETEGHVAHKMTGRLKGFHFSLGNTTFVTMYDTGHPFWTFDVHKQLRQAVADIQRELIYEADRLSHIKGIENE